MSYLFLTAKSGSRSHFTVVVVVIVVVVVLVVVVVVVDLVVRNLTFRHSASSFSSSVRDLNSVPNHSRLILIVMKSCKHFRIDLECFEKFEELKTFKIDLE